MYLKTSLEDPRTHSLEGSDKLKANYVTEKVKKFEGEIIKNIH